MEVLHDVSDGLRELDKRLRDIARGNDIPSTIPVTNTAGWALVEAFQEHSQSIDANAQALQTQAAHVHERAQVLSSEIQFSSRHLGALEGELSQLPVLMEEASLMENHLANIVQQMQNLDSAFQIVWEHREAQKTAAVEHKEAQHLKEFALGRAESKRKALEEAREESAKLHLSAILDQQKQHDQAFRDAVERHRIQANASNLTDSKKKKSKKKKKKQKSKDKRESKSGHGTADCSDSDDGGVVVDDFFSAGAGVGDAEEAAYNEFLADQ